MSPNPVAKSAPIGLMPRARPTRSNAVFRAKVLLHQIRRGLDDCISGPRRFATLDHASCSVLIAESRTALWSDERLAERPYQLGKVHNLRRAAAALHGVVIPAGEVFSFWRQIGRASRRRGYVTGRMLQQGCMVPAVGGGLCQLSNALYDAALQAGCEIVERHGHSRMVPGSAAAAGRDATVAWNYVDLRFRPHQDMRIEARVGRDQLTIRFYGRRAGAVGLSPIPSHPTPQVAQTCATCDEVDCFRHEPPRRGHAADRRTAYLLDENWPEFREFATSAHRDHDVLGIPLDGARWRLPRYRWDTQNFARVGTASIEALRRGLAIRRAPAQGAARRQAELAGSERIARRLAGLLTPEIESVCIAQSLLPFLWRDGHLGGREAAVLMTRLPIAVLQQRLDAAFAMHPDRATLGDFRAPAWLVEAEAEALAYAERIITPHNEIARLFAGKATRLGWHMPAASPRPGATRPRRIAFPGPTVARKGAYEVREVAHHLDLEIRCLGSELEGADFWAGLSVSRADPALGSSAWLDGVAAVMQPGLVEERPRHLLAALAAGVPVVATAACGLEPQRGLTIVPADDLPALIAAVRATLE